jgi:hypothetical protein
MAAETKGDFAPSSMRRRTEAPMNKARECVKADRFELAASLYRQVLDRQPSNWVLLSEVAGFLTYSLRDPKAGADLYSPLCSPFPLACFPPMPCRAAQPARTSA